MSIHVNEEGTIKEVGISSWKPNNVFVTKASSGTCTFDIKFGFGLFFSYAGSGTSSAVRAILAVINTVGGTSKSSGVIEPSNNYNYIYNASLALGANKTYNMSAQTYGNYLGSILWIFG